MLLWRRVADPLFFRSIATEQEGTDFSFQTYLGVLTEKQQRQHAVVIERMFGGRVRHPKDEWNRPPVLSQQRTMR